MPSKLEEEALRRTLSSVEEELSALGLDALTVTRAPEDTLGTGRISLEDVAEIQERLLECSREGERLALGGLLGEGGMGLVFEGRQRVLGREVAVKKLRPELRGGRAERALLWEAWVTGALEHPNVVPVHDIALNAEGEALVVLKRIEGQSLLALLRDEEAMARATAGRDRIDWCLSVVERISDAVRFAHSRGIVHRDIKPENVMIGEFGEVYLLDWGIAVSVRSEAEEGSPRSSDAKSLAGTPAYMAPEMLTGELSLLGPRTDVYLLGGLLYHIVAGRPPHTGRKLQQIVASIVLSEPELPEEVSPEMRALIRRAMHREPERRFPSVEAFAAALAAYREHRSSERIANVARARLPELEALMDASFVMPGALDSGEGAIAGPRERVVELFTELRFALRQALEAWPENARARADLRRAVMLMVGFELTRRNPRAASALLSELEDPPEELSTLVADALAEERRGRRAIRRMKQDRNVVSGRRMRVGAVLIFGLSWCLLPMLPGWLEPDLSNAALHLSALGTSATFFGIFALLLVLRRREIGRTALNRSASLGIALIFVLQVGVHAAALLAGSPFEEALRYHFLLLATLTATAAVMAEKLALTATAIYVVGGLVAASGRVDIPTALALSNLGLVVFYTLLWSFREAEGDRSLAAALWGADADQ